MFGTQYPRVFLGQSAQLDALVSVNAALFVRARYDQEFALCMPTNLGGVKAEFSVFECLFLK